MIIHNRPAFSYDFERLNMLWEKYPQYHEKATFATMEELIPEHESWQEDFESLQEEYMAGGYDRFLIQLSWSDLAYRYETGKLIEKAGPLPENAYVARFMAQFEGLDTAHYACFIFPESYISQFFVVMEVVTATVNFALVVPLQARVPGIPVGAPGIVPLGAAPWEKNWLPSAPHLWSLAHAGFLKEFRRLSIREWKNI